MTSRLDLEKILSRKLAQWCRDNFAALQSCRPKMPSTAHNRPADNWRPLFAIAEVVGGDWPRLVQEAFMKLTARQNRDAQSIGVNLLNDIRQVFARSGRDRFHSKELVSALCASADSPWSEAHTGKAITENWLCDSYGGSELLRVMCGSMSGRRMDLSRVILWRRLRDFWAMGETEMSTTDEQRLQTEGHWILGANRKATDSLASLFVVRVFVKFARP